MATFYSRFASPMGTLVALKTGPFLTGLYLPAHQGWRGIPVGCQQADGQFTDVRQQLAEYFAGERQRFDLPLQFSGTPFQQRVWRKLLKIPCGSTITYAELAQRVGRPRAVRAVGHANGCNPISVIVPCHRVIGTNGQLTGYAGGVEKKRWLLTLEKNSGRHPIDISVQMDKIVPGLKQV